MVNSGLVTAAIALDKGQPPLETWRRTFGWNAWTYLTGLTITVAMLAVLESGLLWCLALAAAPCWLLASYYHAHARKLGAVGARDLT